MGGGERGWEEGGEEGRRGERRGGSPGWGGLGSVSLSGRQREGSVVLGWLARLHMRMVKGRGLGGLVGTRGLHPVRVVRCRNFGWV